MDYMIYYDINTNKFVNKEECLNKKKEKVIINKNKEEYNKNNINQLSTINYIKSVNELFEKHQTEISKAIIHAINYAVTNKRKKIDFAEIIVKGILIIALSIKSNEFDGLLDDNIKILEENEEYELCALAVKLKNKINKTNETVTKKD